MSRKEIIDVTFDDEDMSLTQILSVFYFFKHNTGNFFKTIFLNFKYKCFNDLFNSVSAIF
jgi:hypothetical protein